MTLDESRWKHARHVDYLDTLLVELAARSLQKEGYIGLIVEEPPRHGKSELCSHYFPAWYLGAFPDHRVILTSYESTFADSWGRKVRNTLEEYGKEFYGIEVDPRSSAASRWDIKGHAGGMITAGVGGAITGRGGNLLIVDDPVKDMATAQSEVFRQKHWEWYGSTFRTRWEPDGIILLIGTRWHEDDLLGRVIRAMKEDGGEFGDEFSEDRFFRVRLPAICEPPDDEYPEPDPLGRTPGEALWPERFPVPALAPQQRKVYVWAALYQQRPAPLEGGLFKAEWFEVVPYPGGKFRKVVRYWDLAATDPKKGEDPDWTVGLLLGEHTNGLHYVLDVTRFRKSPGKIEAELRKTAVLDGKSVRVRVEQDPGSAGKMVIRSLGRTVFRGFPFRGARTTGDKMLRAEVVAGACEREEIKVVRGPWNREFFREITRFPNDAHDDQVDAFSGAWDALVSRKAVVTSW